MTKRIIIPGPPGTGKTYRLINTYLKKEVNKHKTPVKKIGFFTFSRTASEVAKQRAIKFANLMGIESIALKKHRDRKTGVVNIVTSKVNVKERDLILVDDMISTGGSIIRSTQFLKKQKCKRVFVACTHALLVNNAENRIKKAGVTEIISTNTIPKKTSKVNVAKIIADAVL